VKKIVWMLAAAVAAIPLPAPAGGTPCFRLDGQSYCYAWSAKNASMMKSEYVRAGESVDHWKRMVTILRYDDVHSLEGATARYMASVKSYLGPDAHPQWVTPKNPNHAQETATRLVLATPDGSYGEYVVAYFYADPGKPAYVIAFSQALPLPSGETPTMAQYGAWLKDMRAIDVPAVER
jgi:hypothetical protein